jgi:FKBP-type peptidyl-prolyl cis-trans isomerase
MAEPGVSAYLADFSITDLRPEITHYIYALAANSITLVRVMDDHGKFKADEYYGPSPSDEKPTSYSANTLLADLRSADPVCTLRALRWLGTKHQKPSEHIDENSHENVPDLDAYWSAAMAPGVRSEVTTLMSSNKEWIAEGAKRCGSLLSDAPAVSPPETESTGQLATRDIKIGSGSEFCPATWSVQKGDSATVEFDGRLPNGEVFDSSRPASDNSASIYVGYYGATEGLSEGMIGMKVGGIREIRVPPNLAFGRVGAGKVPPNIELTYIVHLLNIERDDHRGYVLKSRELLAGTGPKIRAGQTAVFRWRAWLLNGKEVKDPQTPNPRRIVVGSKPDDGMAELVEDMRVGGVRRGLVSDAPRFWTSGGTIEELRLDKIEFSKATGTLKR